MKTRLAARMLVALATGAAFAAQADAEETIGSDKKMKITVGSRVFNATLEDNETAAAFRALLPLTLAMHDVNENEKAHELPSSLPSADSKPRTIRGGDLMLWRSRTLVVFYQSFSSAYRYTRLGRIDDPDGLTEALGAGEVTVKFEIQTR